MRLEAVCAEVRNLEPAEVRDWIARGWVAPEGDAPDWAFRDIDVARVRLVRDLRVDAGIDAESLAVVLSLLDQIGTLRRALATVMDAVAEQPAPVRTAVLAALRG